MFYITYLQALTTNPSALQQNQIIVRFHIDLGTAHSTLDRGPSADDPTALEFREFWGDKSNLRRFMDGAVCEAVVWTAENACDKRHVLGEIVSYILHRLVITNCASI